MPKINLTQTAIDRLTPPAPYPNGTARQAFYYDTEQPGLGLRITSGGAKTFIVEAWHGGRSLRVKIARASDISVPEARRRARVELGRIADGADPNAERRAEQQRTVTLGEAFGDYLETKRGAGKIKPRSVYEYEWMMLGGKNKDGSRKLNGCLSTWLERPLVDVDEAMVSRRHAELAKERGGVQANQAMQLLRAVFTFAQAKYRVHGGAVLDRNPVAILGQTGAWVRVQRRRTVIRPHQLPAWFKAVRELQDANSARALVTRTYLQFVVLHGLRKREAATLKWSDVDKAGRYFTVHETKNSEPHQLPLTEFALELLDELPRVNAYVFHGAAGDGYLGVTAPLMAKVTEASGVTFMLHDLRRTFITIAEGLDIPAYALKRLLNHKMSGDVTAGYIITDVERLRAPMQKITDFMLKAAELKPSAAVIPLEGAAAA